MCDGAEKAVNEVLKQFAWVEEVPLSITVCDENGIILSMNKRSRDVCVFTSLLPSFAFKNDNHNPRMFADVPKGRGKPDWEEPDGLPSSSCQGQGLFDILSFFLFVDLLVHFALGTNTD